MRQSLQLGAARRGESQVFGVWDRATRLFLGAVGVYSVDLAARGGELGYWVRQTAQGFGHARESVMYS